MSTNIYWLVLFGVAFLTSCEEPVDWPLESGPQGRLVVEAIVTNLYGYQEVRLSTSRTSVNEESSVTDANVFLSSPFRSTTFDAHLYDSGLYVSREPFAAQKDVPYKLVIEWREEIYEASSQLSFVAPLEEIVIDRKNEDSLFISEVAPLFHPLEQAMHEVQVDWQHMDATYPSTASLYFYTFSTIDASELLRPQVEEVFFPSGSIITRTKFGLNDEFAAYLRSLALETNWQGGFFDDASSSLPTNISQGGLGFFSVCAILTDSLVAL